MAHLVVLCINSKNTPTTYHPNLKCLLLDIAFENASATQLQPPGHSATVPQPLSYSHVLTWCVVHQLRGHACHPNLECVLLDVAFDDADALGF